MPWSWCIEVSTKNSGSTCLFLKFLELVLLRHQWLPSSWIYWDLCSAKLCQELFSCWLFKILKIGGLIYWEQLLAEPSDVCLYDTIIGIEDSAMKKLWSKGLQYISNCVCNRYEYEGIQILLKWPQDFCSLLSLSLDSVNSIKYAFPFVTCAKRKERYTGNRN